MPDYSQLLSTSTYVTPRTPVQAILNALSEIAAHVAERGATVSREEQAEIIAHHLNDYFGGRLFIALFKKFTPAEIAKMILEDPERAAAVKEKIQKEEDKDEDAR